MIAYLDDFKVKVVNELNSYVYITRDASEINKILSQNNIKYDCIDGGPGFSLYQVCYYDAIGQLIGIRLYKLID